MSTPCYVLGYYLGPHGNAACLLEDGRVRVALQQERLARVKHIGTERRLRSPFPAADPPFRPQVQEMGALFRYCLDTAGIGEEDLTASLSAQDALGKHHLFHAYSSFVASPFEEAAVMVVDGFGDRRALVEGFEEGPVYRQRFPHEVERECFSTYMGRGKELELLQKEYSIPGIGSSVGFVYEAVSDYIFGGYPKRFDYHYEGKTMGLAPYGDPDGFPHTMIEPGPDGKHVFHADWTKQLHHPTDLKNRFQEYADLAAKVQRTLEEVMVARAIELHERTGAKNLCLGGGVALNGLVNAVLLRETPFENIYIPSCPGDPGLAIGAAYYLHLEKLGKGRDLPTQTQHNDYFGKPYSAEEMQAVLAKAPDLRYRRWDDPKELTAKAAEHVAAGDVIAWYQGGSEFGPRALGHRSIVADPRKAEMKDILNARVKFREAFRPFAPSVLAEHAHEYFELPAKESPFMLLIVPVKEDKKEVVPAITHADGTARVQTVSAAHNDLYYELISAFKERTGVPMVLNTSFNVRGEPIIESPQDAVESFLHMDMDRLFLGPFEVWKEPAATDAESLGGRVPRMSEHAYVVEARRAAGGAMQEAVGELRLTWTNRTRRTLTPALSRLLDLVDGERTVAGILAEAGDDAEAVHAALLDLERARFLSLDGEAPPEQTG
jgi:carbamoyltransferase